MPAAAPAPSAPRWSPGPAVFGVSAAVLAAQVVLLRIFSIESYHHFAYMVIGIALLGFGASGTLLVLLRGPLEGRLAGWFEGLCAAFPVVLAGSAWLTERVPFEPTQLLWSNEQWGWLALVYACLTAPFLVAAGALGIALMGAGDRVGRIYAWSLVGSGLGSGFALGFLALARPERALALVVLVAGLAGATALLGRGWSRPRAAGSGILVLFCVAVAVAPPWTLDITPYKGLPQVEAFPDARRTAQAWGPTGWAVSVETPAFRHAPGLSLRYSGGFPRQTALFVDGETAGAATPLPLDDESLAFVDWLPSAAAYAAGPADSVLVLGSGGGLEILNAALHGATHVTDVELVGALVDLRRSALDASSGFPPGSRTVVGDARSFMRRTDHRYDVIVLPLTGALPAVAAGVYALGEDYLNTVESYRSFLGGLSPGGTLAVTRWLRTPPRDNVRLILTAAAALRAEGVEDVGTAMVFLRSWATGTLLVRPVGFTPERVADLRAFAVERGFDVDWPPTPGPVFNTIERPAFAEAVAAAAAGADSARGFARAYPFQVEPPSDDRPYFGRFLELRALAGALRRDAGSWLPFAEWGVLAVVATLVQSGLLALVLMGLPLWTLARRGWGRRAAASAAYFSMLGFGYVFLEMAAIQRLGLLLGHPVYAAAAALAALLTFSGIGAALSDRLAPGRAAPLCLAVAVAASLAALASPAAAAVSALPAVPRIGVALAVVALPGTLMGMPFPTGLRSLALQGRGVAWAWAANGVASVLGASMAVLIAMETGARGLLACAGLVYLAAAAVAWVSRDEVARA